MEMPVDIFRIFKKDWKMLHLRNKIIILKIHA